MATTSPLVEPDRRRRVMAGAFAALDLATCAWLRRGHGDRLLPRILAESADMSAWLALDGTGPYTASMLASLSVVIETAALRGFPRGAGAGAALALVALAQRRAR